MVDVLSHCLLACQGLKYDRITIDCSIFNQFRSLLFRLLGCELKDIENVSQRNIRRQLWGLVIDLSSTPLPWVGPFDQFTKLKGKSFSDFCREQYGEEVGELATEIEECWKDRMCTQFSNPIYTELFTLIGQLRNNQTDFRILATKRQQQFYNPLLNELELITSKVFCSVANMKQHPPFDCLVTCGPFRDGDSIFTAPRYKHIFNVRWHNDEDVSGFPDYMSIEGSTSDAVFPEDFPVRVSITDIHRRVERSEHLLRSETLKSDKKWSFEDFESLFLKRSRLRRTKTSRQGGRIPDNAELKSEYGAVRLHFVDGSFWSKATDHNGKPPFVYSIDRECDTTPIKRRAVLDADNPTQQDLLPGMLVVVEPTASSILRELARVQRDSPKKHLAKWKIKLKEAVDRLTGGVTFAFQSMGHQIENLESKMQRWVRTGNGIGAPQEYETFELVVGKFAGYEDVEEAWDEVLTLRGDHIQEGLARESNIDEYLLSAVSENFDSLVEESRSEISVEGFDEPAVVIELSHVEFFPPGQLSQLGRYTRTEDIE